MVSNLLQHGFAQTTREPARSYSVGSSESKAGNIEKTSKTWSRNPGGENRPLDANEPLDWEQPAKNSPKVVTKPLKNRQKPSLPFVQTI